MDLDLILDNYKNTILKKRLALCFMLGLLPAAFILLEDYDELQILRESALEKVERHRADYNSNKKKVADLGDLESRISGIELSLEKAKKLLPQQVEMNKILASIGGLEVTHKVKVASFSPAEKEEVNQELGYSKTLVKLDLEGSFVSTMKFLDELVHQESLTHIRDINFSGSNKAELKEQKTSSSDGKVSSNVELIIYKGI